MFSLIRLIWVLVTLSTCSIKDGEWSCTEFCLIEVTPGCDSRFTDLSESSLSTLSKYESGFIDFANGYYRNYGNPRHKRRLTNRFMKMVYTINIDLASQSQIPQSETKWITKRLLATYIKLNILAKETVDFALIPEYKGVYHTLGWVLKDLDRNVTHVQGSSNLGMSLSKCSMIIKNTTVVFNA